MERDFPYGVKKYPGRKQCKNAFLDMNTFGPGQGQNDFCDLLSGILKVLNLVGEAHVEKLLGSAVCVKYPD